MAVSQPDSLETEQDFMEEEQAEESVLQVE